MDKIYCWHNGDFTLTTDQSRFDLDDIFRYLTSSAWAKGIDKKTVAGSIESSLCFGLFYKDDQIGFARFVTDKFTFGYLCDVYVVDEWQGKKLGSWMIRCCHKHPSIMKLRRILLVTSTAGWLYDKHNYTPVNEPDYIWQIFRPEIYNNE
ncbi:GNAT family N-acetyltransferase [Photobacterium sp. ZSDE20]|uniref:Histone acetyltransferase n=1 Tax=Vibrio splendidus TaxID=29497 RepID=A0A837NZ73_VIBSP|nr:GNAT family N-acetyltransferase [Vibrio splendidus]KPL96093.1 histone acetyltransferase [Vibrio splendidus]MDD1829778.1 GNAT family N-acetyltransferase [Photobacterium sp. ZSDE20]